MYMKAENGRNEDGRKNSNKLRQNEGKNERSELRIEGVAIQLFQSKRVLWPKRNNGEEGKRTKTMVPRIL